MCPGTGDTLHLAMYEDFAHPWTVQSLADVAQLPRSTFTRTFKEQETIARKVGYQSAVGLHLAFREEYGSAPGSLRHPSPV